MRSRYAEDRLADAVRNGAQQYLILGAGFDTFSYRQPSWARVLRIFEVDHSATQRLKRERLSLAAIEIPSNVEFVALDLDATSLYDGLRDTSFDPRKLTFVSLLGVMVYLSGDAVDSVFRFIASPPQSSEIVFTFVPPAPAVNDEGAKAFHSFAEVTAMRGEPWRTRLESRDLTQKLRRFGFSEISFLTDPEADVRYFNDRHDGLCSPREVRIASAVV